MNQRLEVLPFLLLVTAVCGGSSAVAQDVIINEINYRSATGFEAGDWVELVNRTAEAIDVSDWILTGEGPTDSYVIPTPTELPAGGYLVLASDLAVFGRRFPDVANVIGPLDFGLNAGGELVSLLDRFGAIVDSVRYDDQAPWPNQPDGQGFTLSLLGTDLNNDVPSNWRASVSIGGSPGGDNLFNVLPFEPARIVINEINYHGPTAADAGDWLELVHADPAFGPADLSGWFVRDRDDTNVFVIPPGTILLPGEFLVVVADSSAFSTLHPGVSTFVGEMSFSLSNGGELVRLYSYQNQLVDSLTYDDTAPWPVEPDSLGPTLELLSVTLDNTDPGNWRASLWAGGTPGAANSVVPTTAVDPELPLEAEASLAIFPQPASTSAMVSFIPSNPGLVVLDVFDVRGKRVSRYRTSSSAAGKTHLRIDTASLPPGLYLLSLSEEDASARRGVLVVSR